MEPQFAVDFPELNCAHLCVTDTNRDRCHRLVNRSTQFLPIGQIQIRGDLRNAGQHLDRFRQWLQFTSSSIQAFRQFHLFIAPAVEQLLDGRKIRLTRRGKVFGATSNLPAQLSCHPATLPLRLPQRLHATFACSSRWSRARLSADAAPVVCATRPFRLLHRYTLKRTTARVRVFDPLIPHQR